MPQATQVQTNFTSGELSPRLLGRTDLKKYFNGTRSLENFLVQTHGGVTRRPGTQFVSEVRDSTKPVPRLIEFQYSVDQSYVLEFGVTTTGTGDIGYIRFFRFSGGQPAILIDTTSGGSDPLIKSGLPWNEAELPTLRFTQSADILYVFCPTRPPYQLRRIGTNDVLADSWEYIRLELFDGPWLPINVDETITLTPASTVAGTTSVNVVAPSDKTVFTAVTDVGRHLRLEASSPGFDIVGITTADPGVMTIAGDIFAHGSNVTDTTDYQGTRIEILKMTAGMTQLNDKIIAAGTVTVSGGGATTAIQLKTTDTGEGLDTSTYTPHTAAGADGEARLEPIAWSGWGVITGVTNAYTAVITIKTELPSDQATFNWRLGAWSDTTGWPSTATFYQNRLWTAKTTTEPQTIWSSETGLYSCYSPNTLDDGLVLDTSALTATLADNQVNAVNHILGDSSGLLVMTSGGEWLGRATSPSQPLTPSDMSFQKQSVYGTTGDVVPVRAGSGVLFIQKDKEVIRELVYEFTQDRFVAPNIAILSEHITEGGVVDEGYQQGQDTRVWYPRTDGTLLTLTYDKEQDVIAWQRQVLGISKAGVVPDVVSVGITRGSEEDFTWMIVKRDIAGVTKYFVECLTQPFQISSTHALAFYLDCGVQGDSVGSPTSAWAGLAHLNGEDVYVLADGSTLGPFTVAGGAINLGVGNESEYVTVGLRYPSAFETMPIYPQNAGIDTRGKFKRIYKSYIHLHNSQGGKFGTPDQVYDIEYPAGVGGAPPPLFTGLKEVNMPDNSLKETVVRYEQNDAQPSTVLAITMEFDVGGV